MNAHPFTPPGQVAPDRSAPDACMRCGAPSAEHPPSTQQEIAHAAAVLSRLLSSGPVPDVTWAIEKVGPSWQIGLEGLAGEVFCGGPAQQQAAVEGWARALGVEASAGGRAPREGREYLEARAEVDGIPVVVWARFEARNDAGVAPTLEEREFQRCLENAQDR